MSAPSLQSDRLKTALAGRYRIERELGAGGMATVYLAFDEKHDRKVAIKVLKPELAAVLGAERFVVEIKTTAAMSHPHILPLFDSGTADGFLFYVMPYIEGETIREKLNRETQFGVDEAVRIAREVADALDYAHRHGVIHRDIKPENILLHDGRAMVMDFGIALAVSAAAGGRMTETGLSLGTPHYMSPEQATAEKEITARSDVYSLASVLYEMLAGQPPHIGGAAQQVIMKIITERAQPVSSLRKSVPANVDAALAKGLEKLPADRFESSKAFADALGNATFTTGTGQRSSRAPGGVTHWRERVALPALALSAVLVAVTAWALLRPHAPAPLSRYRVELTAGKRLGATQWSPFAVSHDGSKLVYFGETGRLWLRSRDQLDAVELAGTEGAFNPFFSPDDQKIGFMVGAPGSSEIKAIPVSGGPLTSIISKGVGGPGAAWGYDGYIYFDASGIGPLRRVRATGGEDSEEISVRDSARGDLQHNWPDPLPNGRGMIITVDQGGPGVNVSPNNDIAVIDLATHKHKILAKGVLARYSASGHLLIVTSKGSVLAVPFDQNRMELTGSPTTILEGITIRRGGGGIDLAISQSGTLWYGAGSKVNGQEAVWVSRNGDATPVEPGWTGDFSDLALSPDGSKLAVSVVDASGQQIWVKHLGGSKGIFSKLTFEGVNVRPRWHPGGNELMYRAQFVPSHNLRSVRADGLAQTGTVLAPAVTGRIYSGHWSNDGKWMVLEHGPGSLGRDIVGVRVGGDSTPVPMLTSKFSESLPSVSPDGRWLLYTSNSTGAIEAYVRPFPDASRAVYQVSTGGAFDPKWSRDGREIFYRSPSNQMVTIPVMPGPQFATGEPRVLFAMPNIAEWDVAPGGQRFIMIRDREGNVGSRIVTVENFFAELKAKVPAK